MATRRRPGETPGATPPAPPSPTSTPAAVWMRREEITPWANNPRRNDPVVPTIVRSIREFGFPSALIVYPEGGNLLVAGHTRMKALDAILVEDPTFTLAGAPGPGMVPVRLHTFRDRAQAEAYAVADNKLNEAAEWDDALLHQLAHEILESDGMGMLGVMGFDDSEIGRILADPPVEGGGEGEGGPKPPPRPAGTRHGAEGAQPVAMRLVQLFLPEADHVEFHAILATLGAMLGKTDQGEIVMHALRALAEVSS